MINIGQILNLNVTLNYQMKQVFDVMAKEFLIMHDIKKNHLPINPAGKLTSVRTLPSTLMVRCITILVTSSRVKAYFKRLRSITTNGNDSLNLCGPQDGLGA